MAKFMFIYRGGEGEPAEMSPEELQSVMQKWMEWIGKGMEAGWMLDGGDALHPTGKVVQVDGTITDGPFAESKELVGGYSMIQADDLEQAAQFTAGCPIFEAGGAVEVRELVNTGAVESA